MSILKSAINVTVCINHSHHQEKQGIHDTNKGRDGFYFCDVEQQPKIRVSEAPTDPLLSRNITGLLNLHTS